MNWRAPWAAGVGVTLAVSILGAVWAGGADARGAPASKSAPSGDPVRLLDVPYVPQSAALCGGAAVAMVLRYWGEPGARAEDFTAQLSPGGDGIRDGS